MTEALPAQVDVSVLVVTYECADWIAACLDSVRRTVRRHRVEVIVVDNASADDTASRARAADPDAKVICRPDNGGFAVANNDGARRASGRYLLLLNPDAELGVGALDALVDLLDGDAAAGAAAPRLVYPDGTDQRTARAFPTAAAAVLGRRSPLTRLAPGNRWSRRYLMPTAGTGPYPVDWVSGACLLIRHDLFDELGGLDEGFFMHWEDADLCHRVADAGRTVLCLPTVTAVHAEGLSRRGWPAAQVRYFHAGAYRYWTRHCPPAARPLRPLVAVALGSRAALVIAGNALRRPASGEPAAPVVDEVAA